MRNDKRPFLETFKWQSGKSLKQNLVDFGHSFWSLPVLSEVHEVFWPKKSNEIFEQFFIQLFFQRAFLIIDPAPVHFK